MVVPAEARGADEPADALELELELVGAVEAAGRLVAYSGAFVGAPDEEGTRLAPGLYVLVGSLLAPGLVDAVGTIDAVLSRGKSWKSRGMMEAVFGGGLLPPGRVS